MNRRRQAGIYFLVALLAGSAGFYFSSRNLTSSIADGAAQRLMLMSLSDFNDEVQKLSQWRGKVLVVNFWATWCLPCREEIPALMKIQHKYASNGVKIIGIAIDDASKVRDFAREMRIDYVLLIGGIEILGASSDLGNRTGVLPFTLVLDRTGKAEFAHAGALTEALLDAVLAPLL